MLCSCNYYTWKHFHIYSLWVASDSGTVNLNRPLHSLFFSRLRRTSLLPPGLAASGNFWVAAFGGRLTRSRAGQQPPAWPCSRGD